MRRVDAASGVITTVAGGGASFGDGGPATAAQIDAHRVALDSDGNLYIASRMQYRIRKVDAAGIITTVAGTGVAGPSGDGGPATSAELYAPTDLELDQQGNLYIVEPDAGRLRRVTPDGKITTVTRITASCWNGDGRPIGETCMALQGVTVDRSVPRARAGASLEQRAILLGLVRPGHLRGSSGT